ARPFLYLYGTGHGDGPGGDSRPPEHPRCPRGTGFRGGHPRLLAPGGAAMTTSIPDPVVGIIGSMSRVSSPVFVGRAGELARLSGALETAAAGHPCTRLITGEAGIGKSRLVEEFLTRARASDSLVLEGDCLPLGETGLAYAPFVAALRPL